MTALLRNKLKNNNNNVDFPTQNVHIFATEMWQKEFTNHYKQSLPPALIANDADNLTDESFKAVLWHATQEFGEQTTIHGVNHIVSSKMGKTGRLLWCLGFLTALLLLIYVTVTVASRYNRRQFQTVVETTKYPIYKIYYPEITICNQNRLNWSRLTEAKARYLLREHHNTTHEQLFTQVVASFDTLTFAEFDKFRNLNNNSANLETLNYVNFSSVVAFMSWRCDELLRDCWWSELKIACCEIFFLRKSQYGTCLAFNTIETREGLLKQLVDPFWPWRTSKMGLGTGLKLRVLLREEHHSPYSFNNKGLTIMMTEPYAWFGFTIEIPIHTTNSIAIDAVLHFYDNITRSLPSNVRECVFQEERNSKDYKTLFGHRYMFENCQSECQQKYLMHYCNCTMDLLYPPGPYPACKLSDYPCLAKYNDHLLYFEQPGERQYVTNKVRGMECQCFLNCISLTYVTDVSSTVIAPDERELNDSYIDLDFYFMRDYMLVYRTTLVYTWVDLMVSFGGIAGLFLGCSLISLVELAYFLIVNMPKSLWKEYKNTLSTKEKRHKFRDTANQFITERRRL